MNDIESKLKENESKIEGAIAEIKNIKSCAHMLLAESSKCSSEITFLKNLLENYKMKQEKSIKLIYVWLLFSVALIMASIAMTQMGKEFLKIVESISSWGTCLFLIAGGIYSAKMAHRIDKVAGYVVSASWALISTCYIGYVLFDFGSIHPQAGAIGFNLGASAQTIALIVVLVRLLKKNG